MKPDIENDPVAVALADLRAELFFIDEYRSQFEALRARDPQMAETMLFHLAGTTETAIEAYNILVELLLAGKTICPNEPLAKDLRLLKKRSS